MTRVFGVVGYPISHSLSPVMHHAALEALGLEGIYSSFEVPPRELGRVLGGLQAAGIDGLNITVPHKERVIRYLDRRTGIDETALRIGAVNTLVRQDRHFVGYNTDVRGFRRALVEELRFDCRKKRILLLGAGGAARAVGWALLTCGASAITVANRTQAHARRLVRWLRGCGSRVTLQTMPFGPQAITEMLKHVDLLINATSLGLHPGDSLPIHPAALHKRLVVFDLVYRSPTTTLVREARRRGVLAIDGVPMLVYQGAESFRLWWRRRPPISAMRHAVERAIRNTSP